MQGSCSSNILNGCAGCGPDLVLFAIAATTSKSIEGFSCLDGSDPNPPKRYFSESAQASLSYNASDNVINLSTNDSAGYSYTENITCFVDKFGAIVCTSTMFSNVRDNGSYKDAPFGSAGTNYTYGGSQSCSKEPRKSSCEPEPGTICKSGGDCANGTLSCPGDPESWNCMQEVCDDSLSCTSHTRNGSDSSFGSGGANGNNFWAKSTGSYRFQRKISDSKSLSYFYDLCKSSVSTKIGIKEANQPQNCNGDTCGEGKDDCWGGGGGCFEIADNNLDDPNANSTTAQKVKFKIATIKEGFEKEYKSVSGKVKFYIPSEEDIEEGRTPCCNDDFSGTVVKEAAYSISAGSTFKDDYLASDAGDFDNSDQSHVGETICPCYTIDSVSFI